MNGLFVLTVLLINCSIQVTPTKKHHCVARPAPPGEIPSCVKSGMTFCEDADDYPWDLIEYLLNEKKLDFLSLFRNESEEEYKEPQRSAKRFGPVIPMFMLPTAKELPRQFRFPKLNSINTTSKKSPTIIRKRRQNTPENEALCRTRSLYFMPRVAMNYNHEWMFVINMPEMNTVYTQMVKSEICEDTEKCTDICQLPVGYKSRCEQRYVQKRLIAVSMDGMVLTKDVFWFPSCCVCTISLKKAPQPTVF